MKLTDGASIGAPHLMATDVVVVGSGPAGATVARDLAAAGVDVVVVEEGPWIQPAESPLDGFAAMALGYRDMGTSVLMGSAPMPFLQGRAVGGGSLINGAISWRLPRDVHREWVDADPALGDSLPWEWISERLDRIERELNIHPTDERLAGPNNLLLGRGAAALGLEHRPIRRYVRGCQGLGRCLQGCPGGHKQGMDRTYLPEAIAHGAELLCSTRVDGLTLERGRATGVTALAEGGGRVQIQADRAVVLAASAVQTPALLLRSRLRHGPVGEGFQCHPGVSMAGRFPDPVRMWTGATQGHEVIGLRHDGLKFEALGYDISLVATRLKGFGAALSDELADIAHYANWGAAVRATARGQVKAGRRRASVRFSMTREDMARVRRGVQVLGEMMLAAGADFVAPGVHGWHARVEEPGVMARFQEEASWSPKAYAMAVTHMFGTCRMGSDPARSVVRPDFRHHTADRLYVADSSVFPTNTGVNPQTSIIALAMRCADRVLAEGC